MRQFLKYTLLSSSMLALTTSLAAAEPKVVASIKPIHSLVSAVMKGVGTPELIVQGAASPHDYALKPSQAAALEKADLVFWVGHEMETFLEKPIETIAAKSTAIELIDTKGLAIYEFREDGAFEDHDHEDHAKEGHDGHKHEDHAEHDHDKHKHEEHAEHDHDEHKHEEHAEHDHDEHKHEEHAEHGHDEHKDEEHAEHDHDEHKHEEHAEDGHEGHDHGSTDAHIWLDPVNAKVLVHEIEHALAKADPENAAKYEANAEALEAELDALVTEVSASVSGVQGKPYIVFHDAYQYFEKRFGMTPTGSITVSPEVAPGAERVSRIREKIKSLNATCVFAEPQFEPKIISTVTEGTNARSGVIDPLGATLADGPSLYPELIRNMATSMKECLSEAS